MEPMIQNIVFIHVQLSDSRQFIGFVLIAIDDTKIFMREIGKFSTNFRRKKQKQHIKQQSTDYYFVKLCIIHQFIDGFLLGTWYCNRLLMCVTWLTLIVHCYFKIQISVTIVTRRYFYGFVIILFLVRWCLSHSVPFSIMALKPFRLLWHKRLPTLLNI